MSYTPRRDRIPRTRSAQTVASTLNTRSILSPEEILGSLQAAARTALKSREVIESRDAESCAETPRFVDLYLHDVFDDPVAAVRTVYAAFGLTMTDEYVAKLRAWQKTNTRSPDDVSEMQLPYEPSTLTTRFCADGYAQKFPGVLPFVNVLPGGSDTVEVTSIADASH